MTVPSERPISASPADADSDQRLDGTPHGWIRRRRAIALGGVLGVAVLAAALVYVFPSIAVPVGTALAFIAVVPPLMQWLTRR